MSIITLVPSRGRPDRAARMVEAYEATAQEPDTEVLVLVDPDDPTLDQYTVHHMVLPERMGFTRSLNYAAEQMWDRYDALGAFGDDVIFRTPGWDTRVKVSLITPGIAYGDDLIHGKKHPSAVWMSSAIARALGWLALPATSHQWADDAWKTLGESTQRLRFLEGVIVEHEHPAVGKADWDDTYQSVFNDVRAAGDYAGFEAWKRHWLPCDLGKISVMLDELEQARGRVE